MSHPLRGSIAIVGAAESDLGQCPPGTTPQDLMAQATRRALDDCGLQLGDIDAVFTATTQLPFPAISLCDYLGLRPRYVDGSNLGGASFLSHVQHAMGAIEAGLCEVALIAYGSNQRSLGRSKAAPQEISPYESFYKPRFPVNAYAMAAARHMHEYGTTREQLAEVAVAARKWAQRNPKAWDREALSIEQVLASPMVSHPLTLRDCCLVTDGGGALIVTSARRAAAEDLRRKAVYVLGCADAVSHRHISGMHDLTRSSAVESGRAAYAMAGLSVQDVDVAELYDATSLMTILGLELYGFAPTGQGWRHVVDPGTGPASPLPVNTHGGHLSEGYVHGMTGLLEAVRQVRGEAANQIAGVDVALFGAPSGSAVVLGRS